MQALAMYIFNSVLNNCMKMQEFKKSYSWTAKKTGKTTTVQETMVELICDCCNKLHTRTKSHYAKMQKNPLFSQDFCNKCWQALQNNQPARIEKMTKGVRDAYQNPVVRERLSQAMKGVNLGEKNAMKRADVRAKVSATRSVLMQDPEFRFKFKQGSIDAWARGAYDNSQLLGLQMGYTKWYDYTHSSGVTYKVQGKYELAFIKFLDENTLTFECHHGKIPYVADDGLTHHYFPDFYVHTWQCYVDPKATHWYKKQYRKFELLAEQHPDIRIEILTEDKLRKLGIKL